ncbi:MAG: acetyl-CoA C-acyltransferase [bacterium]
MELKDVVVVSACRTPMGRFGGTLRDMTAYDLGAVAVKEALKRANLKGDQVDDVLLGSCRQAGNGPNPARPAAVRGGVSVGVPVMTLNMACPSGMRALSQASQSIRLGDANTVIIGGFDSMSTIPYLLKDVRWQGFKMGDKTLLDGWADSIDPLCGFGMGMTAEHIAEKLGIAREEQDKFAYESHMKAAKAQDQGWFDEEIVSVEVPQRKGEPVIFDKDETIRRDTSPEKLGKLRPVFKKDGCVTAGNACQMSDGAAVRVIMSRAKAEDFGLKPLFSLVSYAQTAVDPATMGEGPGFVIPIALERAGMSLTDMDLIEVNEAFAVQILANEQKLRWDRAKLNVHGGAIALGHPTGISGARIVVTLYHALKRMGKELGIAAICGGGGVTMATVIRREN